jgi:hypothetical protein
MNRQYEILTDDNILMYSIIHYNNPHNTGISEFFEDFKKISSIKKKFSLYETTGKINERLVLNYFIMLYNVFEPIPLMRILFFKITEKHHSILKTFLVFLNRITDNSDGIQIDFKIADILRGV